MALKLMAQLINSISCLSTKFMAKHQLYSFGCILKREHSLNSYYIASWPLPHLIFTAALGGKNYYPHFTDKKVKFK